MENETAFKNINHEDVGLLSVSTYVKRHGAFKFAMKYNDRVYESILECDDGNFGPGVFIKLFEKYFASKKSNVLFLKKIPLYELNGKKYTIMIKMKFKHSDKIVTNKIYHQSRKSNSIRIAYEPDTIYNDEDETVTYREQMLQCTYYIYTFTRTKYYKSKIPKLYKAPIPMLLVKSTIELHEHEPWDHKPNGYFTLPCITKCELKFNEGDYEDDWDYFEMMRSSFR